MPRPSPFDGKGGLNHDAPHLNFTNTYRFPVFTAFRFSVPLIDR
jgi:hypothetical protein